MLADCLISIERYPPACDYEIIVVDNNSSDGSQAAVAAYCHTRLIQNSDNAGFAKANNQAFQIAQGEFFLMLNADTQVNIS